MKVVYQKMLAIASCLMIAASGTVGAKETVGSLVQKPSLKSTAAACNPASATIDNDINNVRSRLMTGGDMWYDRGTGTARYEVPKGSGKNSLFAGSVWVGGIDDQKALKVAAQLYRSKGNDYWPGPTQVDASGVNLAPDKTICSDWDRFWKIDKSTLIDFQDRVKRGDLSYASDPVFQSIREWPATGNRNAVGTSGLPLDQLTNNNYIKYQRNYAPFVDADGDGMYDYTKGDYPDILGDQYIWWVFNDMGNVKLQTGTNAIGMEVQTSAFAYSSKDYLNDATFIFYKLINRGTLNLDSTYMATWTDADLGDAFDDYIGCDTARSLGILYNGKSIDGTGKPTDYGSQVPMIGVDFFIGPKRRTYDSLGTHVGPHGHYFEDTLGMTVFNYFTNSGTLPYGDPSTGLEIYRVMTAFDKVGTHLHMDMGACPGGSTGFGPGPDVNFVYFGNPDKPGEWSECQCNNTPGDRRFVHSSGPFKLEAGGITNDIIIGVTWVPNVGGCPNTNFSRIRAADDEIQDLFDNHFRTIEGPEAPRLVVREMDRHLIFYLVNDSSSTNFQEKFGFDTAAKYRVSTPKTRKLAKNGDSLYKFEGYRVFQLKNSTVTTNNIFDQNGEVNTALAAEVFQTDIKNGVDKLVNYTGNPDKGLGVYDAAVKVTGKDSGIQHSFELTNDYFSNSSDKRFVNYRTYYFVAIAYAQNNFRKFTYALADSSQQTPYMESEHSAGGRPLQVVAAMPNPANGDMGTVVNSDFGSGITIKRIEGIGNGGLATDFDPATEETALTSAPDYQAKQPTYAAGSGPIGVKVVDPRLVQPVDWSLYIYGKNASLTDSTLGLVDSMSYWKLVCSDGTTIFSERNLKSMNEQIAEKYGISIEITQAHRPGDKYLNQVDTPNFSISYANNGYITSSISYINPSLAWLAGVNDGEGTTPLNWIRSGSFANPAESTTCDYSDIGVVTTTQGTSFNNPDSAQVYEGLLSSSTANKGTWAPASLAAYQRKGDCNFEPGSDELKKVKLQTLMGVDVVFTSDKSKWSKVLILEMQDDQTLAQGKALKFTKRSHQSWNGNIDGSGNPVYSTTSKDTGFTLFPGYAIDQETGARVNIVIGEDSYLQNDNGADMLWNPTNKVLDPATGSVIFGGKHYIYVLNTKYDGDDLLNQHLDPNSGDPAPYTNFKWVGVPTLLNNQQLLSLSDGLIPTETRIRIRVTKPYGRYLPDGVNPGANNGYPLYTFSTANLAPRTLTATDNMWHNDKQGLLDQIHVTPNPYYGYVQYENSRLDTRVRIVNLPKTATIHIYSLDGTLIRTLTKDDANTSYIDWDTKNAKGLTIASGMYLFHVVADGIGETTIRWFGAFRPTDITTY